MSIQREILVGTAWVAAARWGIRGLGVVSTMVLARLLVPDDFGLVALATMVAGMIAIFAEVGMLLHLIREPDPDRTHFDTVWTLRLMLGGSLAAVIFVVAPFAADWFNDPRLETVLRWLALPSLMQGLQNPGVVWFRKNLDFRRDFLFLLSQKVVSFAVALSAAALLRDYRALVAGIVAGGAAGLLRPVAHTRGVALLDLDAGAPHRGLSLAPDRHADPWPLSPIGGCRALFGLPRSRHLAG
jgi:O-antigen/teichoic acid export membrane protein